MTIKIECEVSDLSNAMDAAHERARQQLKEEGNQRIALLVSELKTADAELKFLRSQLEGFNSESKVDQAMSMSRVRDLMIACFKGQKLSAIKEIRMVTSCGLKEAKELFESAYGEACFEDKGGQQTQHTYGRPPITKG